MKNIRMHIKNVGDSDVKGGTFWERVQMKIGHKTLEWVDDSMPSYFYKVFNSFSNTILKNAKRKK